MYIRRQLQQNSLVMQHVVHQNEFFPIKFRFSTTFPVSIVLCFEQSIGRPDGETKAEITDRQRLYFRSIEVTSEVLYGNYQ